MKLQELDKKVLHVRIQPAKDPSLKAKPATGLAPESIQGTPKDVILTAL